MPEREETQPQRKADHHAAQSSADEYTSRYTWRECVINAEDCRIRAERNPNHRCRLLEEAETLGRHRRKSGLTFKALEAQQCFLCFSDLRTGIEKLANCFPVSRYLGT
jgi:hypothetical protein